MPTVSAFVNKLFCVWGDFSLDCAMSSNQRETQTESNDILPNMKIPNRAKPLRKALKKLSFDLIQVLGA
jgi:hypothetical protein